MARGRKPTEGTTADTAIVEQAADAIKDGWYWFGAVPASQDVLIRLPQKEMRMGAGGTRTNLIPEKFRPWDLWRGVTELGEHKMFVGKLPQHGNIGVRGFGFPGFSEHVEKSDGQVNRMAFAGCATRLRRKQVEGIIWACFQTWIRFPGGIDSVETALSDSLQFIDGVGDKKPPGMTDEDWARAPKLRTDEIEFHSETDIRVAEFVYLARFDGSDASGYALPDVPWQPKGFDDRDYNWHANRFHQTICPMVTEDLFNHPPKSVAEMYPEFAPEEEA